MSCRARSFAVEDGAKEFSFSSSTAGTSIEGSSSSNSASAEGSSSWNGPHLIHVSQKLVSCNTQPTTKSHHGTGYHEMFNTEMSLDFE